MKQATTTPYRMTLPGMRIMLVVAGVLVFSVGISLNMLTEQTDRFFAWTIATPLTAAFLGAAYWSACVLELLAARERLWVRARIAVPTLLLFTVLTLIVTLIHIDKFHMTSEDMITRAGTLVLAVCVCGGAHRHGHSLDYAGCVCAASTRRGAYPPPSWMRVVLAVQAVILIGVGVCLLLVPTVIAPYWPWALTPLTGRAIGAWLASIGIAAAQSVWENDLERVRFASPPSRMPSSDCSSRLRSSRFSNNVNWNTTAAWLYVIFLLSMVGIGLVSWLVARRLPERDVLAAGSAN